MKCYLCNQTDFKVRKGVVCSDRTASGNGDPSLKVLECNNCGLVLLNSFDHIKSNHYEDSGMHDDSLETMDVWLNETEQDDRRRFNMLKSIISNSKVLDFGSGAGGFVHKAQSISDTVAGIEPENRVHEFWKGRVKLYKKLSDAGKEYDLITAFHVLEHLPEPINMLKELAVCLKDGGRIVIEVPSSEDALLTLYNNEGYQNFTYWDQHLFLFNQQTLRHVAEKAGLRVVVIKQFQRYSLSNHLHWLSKNKPGGHQSWAFIDSPILTEAYAASLASLGKSDTLIAYLEKE